MAPGGYDTSRCQAISQIGISQVSQRILFRKAILQIGLREKLRSIGEYVAAVVLECFGVREDDDPADYWKK